MELETAQKFIDRLLEEDDPCGLLNFDIEMASWLYSSGITLDFIGGDALMQPALLDQILSYWAKKIYTTKTKNAQHWQKNWRVSISSNGTLFENPEVRAFIEDWLPVLSIGVSIDGCPSIHNANRIFPDGKPSLPSIQKNWDWYREKFPKESRTTKATCARNSIPFLAESLRFMHEELGLFWINQNFIMERNGCTKADYEELKKQMELCVDYVFQHKDSLYWSMIDEEEFAKARKSTGQDWTKKGRCGSGAMPAVGIDGKIYPCFRFLPHTQEAKSPLICGDVDKGFFNKEAFQAVCEAAYRNNCTKEENCRNCEYESACAYCIAGCYSEFGQFQRQTHICEITKIQCEYARKYWNKIRGEK